MDTVFMDSENSKTSKPHVVIPNLNDKIDLRKGEKSVVLSNLTIYYPWKTWNGPYSISDIQDYFGYVLKKHQEKDW